MPVTCDHIIFGCNHLKTGVTQLSETLGVDPGGFCVHAMMGTHNALWGMGDAYIELVAIDPEAEAPGRARWFGLDAATIQERFEQGPCLLTWAVAADPLNPVVQAAPVPLGPIERFSRDDLMWDVAVPIGGEPGLNGAFPLTLCWQQGRHPAKRLPDVGLRLEQLTIAHPEISSVRRALGPVRGKVAFQEAGKTLHCLIGNGNEVLEFVS